MKEGWAVDSKQQGQSQVRPWGKVHLGVSGPQTRAETYWKLHGARTAPEKSNVKASQLDSNSAAEKYYYKKSNWIRDFFPLNPRGEMKPDFAEYWRQEKN